MDSDMRRAKGIYNFTSRNLDFFDDFKDIHMVGGNLTTAVLEYKCLPRGFASLQEASGLESQEQDPLVDQRKEIQEVCEELRLLGISYPRSYDAIRQVGRIHPE